MTTTSSRHLTYRSGRGTNEHYTPAEDARIVAQWSRGPLRALAPVLNRSESSIVGHARKLVARGLLKRSAQFYWRRWTVRQTDYLAEHWGLVPDAVIAKRLHRTVKACLDQAYSISIQRKDAFLTGQEVARLLHIDSHRVTYLHEHGWLKLTRSHIGNGRWHWWRCELADLERFLRHHPAQYDPRRITDEPWRALAHEAHRKAALLTIDEAAARLGIARETVVKACRSGRIPAEKATTHGGTGTWLIRTADLSRWRRKRAGGLRAAAITPARRPLRFPKQVERRLRVRFRPVDWRTS